MRKKLLGALAIMLFVFLGSEAYCEDYVFIVNKQGPYTSGISADTLRNVYLGDKRFEAGTALIPVNAGEGDIKDAVFKRFLNMSAKDYKRYWVKKVFQDGLAVPPTIVNPYETVEYVKREKGAIAYIPASILKFVEGVVIVKP